MKKSINKALIPYLIVFYPISENTAVYNRDYQLIFEGASQALIQFAENRSSLLIQTGFNLSDPKQQPSWINENIKQDCLLYFCYNDGTDDLDLQKIPLS